MSNLILTKHPHDKPKSELDNSFPVVKVVIAVVIVIVASIALWMSHLYNEKSLSDSSTKSTLVNHMKHIDTVKKQVDADINDTKSKQDSITKWVSKTGDEIHKLQDSVNNKEQQVKDLQNQLNN